MNAREVDTGRYHPPLLELNIDGTGRIQNSNNFGGINPVTGKFVDLDFGEEYIVDLSFDPESLTIGNSPAAGDLNGDCEINLLDVAPFIDAVANGSFNFLADINGDLAVNLLDVAAFVDLLGS